MILDIMFTFYCMKFYQRHHLMSKSFSPPQRRHGVCVTISIYTLVLPIYVLFLCDFTCVVWLMGQLWPFCVNKMTTTTLLTMGWQCAQWYWSVQKVCIEMCLNMLVWQYYHSWRVLHRCLAGVLSIGPLAINWREIWVKLKNWFLNKYCTGFVPFDTPCD